MKELKTDLLTGKYTKVLVEENFQYHAPHSFRVIHAAESTVPQAFSGRSD